MSIYDVWSSYALVTRVTITYDDFTKKKSFVIACTVFWMFRYRDYVRNLKSVKKSWKHFVFAYLYRLKQVFRMAVGVGYRNFFIPRVEKNLKISPWDEKACLPRAYGAWEETFPSRGLIFVGFFNPLGWRNFYTRYPAHSEIPYFLMRNLNFWLKIFILNFWCFRLLRPCIKWRGRKKKNQPRSTNIHEILKIRSVWSVDTWHHKTSTK